MNQTVTRVEGRAGTPTLLPLHQRTGPCGPPAKVCDGFRSVFCAVPYLPSDLLRNIAAWAGEPVAAGVTEFHDEICRHGTRLYLLGTTG